MTLMLLETRNGGLQRCTSLCGVAFWGCLMVGGMEDNDGGEHPVMHDIGVEAFGGHVHRLDLSAYQAAML